MLDADVPGFTVAPQHLQIGAGLTKRPSFHLVQHGDYSMGFPAGPRPHGQLPRLIDLPETVADHLARSRRLGLNLFVDRLGNLGNGVGEVARDDALIERLKADPLAVAPEKAMFEGSGLRIAVGCELGTLAVLDKAGNRSGRARYAGFARANLAAEPRPPRRHLDGASHTVRSQYDRKVAHDVDSRTAPAGSVALAKDTTPTVRKTGWGNASATPLSLTPNLLAESKAIIGAVHAPRTHGDPRPCQNKIDVLIDGKPDAPPRPWLEWTDIGYIDSGWRNKLTLEIDTFRTQLRVNAITFVEDPAHPESWLRDLRLEWWDPAKEAWQPGPYLLSYAAVHSHVLEKPIEAAKFRFSPDGKILA